MPGYESTMQKWAILILGIAFIAVASPHYKSVLTNFMTNGNYTAEKDLCGACSVSPKETDPKCFMEVVLRRVEIIPVTGNRGFLRPKIVYVKANRLRCLMPEVASNPGMKETSTPQSNPSNSSSSSQEPSSAEASVGNTDAARPSDRGATVLPEERFLKTVLQRQKCPVPGNASKPGLNESSTAQSNRSDVSSPKEASSSQPSDAEPERQPWNLVSFLTEIIYNGIHVAVLIMLLLLINIRAWQSAENHQLPPIPPE